MSDIKMLAEDLTKQADYTKLALDNPNEFEAEEVIGLVLENQELILRGLAAFLEMIAGAVPATLETK